MNGVKTLLTSDSIGGSPPASSSKIFQFVISAKRVATMAPADPAPIMMKSYSGRPFGIKPDFWCH